MEISRLAQRVQQAVIRNNQQNTVQQHVQAYKQTAVNNRQQSDILNLNSRKISSFAAGNNNQAAQQAAFNNAIQSLIPSAGQGMESDYEGRNLATEYNNIFASMASTLPLLPDMTRIIPPELAETLARTSGEDMPDSVDNGIDWLDAQGGGAAMMEEISDKMEQIVILKEEIVDLKEQVKVKEAIVANLESQKQTRQNTISGLQSQINALQPDLTYQEWEDQGSWVENDSDTDKTQRWESNWVLVTKTNWSIANQINSLNQQINNEQAQINSLNQQIQAEQTLIQTLNNTIVSKKAKQDALQARVDYLRNTSYGYESTQQGLGSTISGIIQFVQQ